VPSLEFEKKNKKLKKLFFEKKFYFDQKWQKSLFFPIASPLMVY